MMQTSERSLTVYLVLLETSGNQNFIFSTNKLKENFGASEQTYRAGTEWVLHAISRECGNRLWDNNATTLRENLLSARKNPPIENDNSKIEVIVATSGKALLLTKDKGLAQRLIERVTRTALKVAPGLDICGVWEEFNWYDSNNSLGKANKRVHEEFAEVRARRPSPELRFLRLPVVADCSTSSWPASRLNQIAGELVPQSHVSQQKRRFTDYASQRMQVLLDRERGDIDLAASLRVLDREFGSVDDVNDAETRSRGLNWFAIVHADGNGLGEIILKFESHLEKLRLKLPSQNNTSQSSQETTAVNNREYADKIRAFSIGLDICTEQAFLKALNTFLPTPSNSQNNATTPVKQLVPLVPLVLGGDDLTVICDGQKALRFTHAFLKEFEGQTQNNIPLLGNHQAILREIAQEALGAPRLSACGGVAIVKPHFPFSKAYELSESLMQSAKTVKRQVQNPQKPDTPWPCSSLDFHIVYDASGVELEQIRKKLEIDSGETKLYASPYIITSPNDLTPATGSDWVENHKWEDLSRKIELLNATTEDGKRKLPNSQMHELRAGLFLGRQKANARLNLIWQRYQNEGLNGLVASSNPSPSLFWTENGKYVTAFLHALDAVDFLKGEEW